MIATARGRSYADGPYSFCDRADIHPQPCTCAAPHLGPVEGADDFAMETLGQVMAAILGANEPRSGPPYTHTFRPPQEFYTRLGKLLYWEKPGPAYTLTEGT